MPAGCHPVITSDLSWLGDGLVYSLRNCHTVEDGDGDDGTRLQLDSAIRIVLPTADGPTVQMVQVGWDGWVSALTGMCQPLVCVATKAGVH